MGTVYLAEHPVIGSKVAIKFLHESMSSDAELVGRFYDEARVVNLIGHENIVGIFDLNTIPPNRYYIVMEYLEGETLTALLRRGPVDGRVALEILLQLCDALHCAHGRGVVHRDLKPDNVFLLKSRGQTHFVKLVDFGIAKLRDRPSGGHTAAGMIVGTPEYMAPEQCDDRQVDARTDVYALGVIAYELATGQLPFSGKSIAQLLLAHLHEVPRPPRQINGSVHPLFEAAVLKALAKAPEERFPDMGAFGDALAEVLDALAVGAEMPAPPPPREAPAVAQPAPAVPLVQVEIQAPGESAPRHLSAGEITRGGMYVHSAGKQPALFSRLRVRLPRPAPQAPVDLEAEVVRLVSPADAASWGMVPGFALQFVNLSPQQRAALPAAAPGAARGGQAPSTPAPGATDEAAALALLESLLKRAEGSHYDLLGVPPDAEFADVRSRAKALRSDIAALRGRALPPEQAGRVGGLMEKVELAVAVLGTPTERLTYDARRGNHAGVARCVASGLPAAVVESRRRDFLAERPGLEEESQRHLARARVARALRNDAAAIAEYEAALAKDPLNLGIHEAYWSLKREMGHA
jgi:serine/threonine-protein kinase